MIKEKHVKPEKFKMRRSVKERLLVAALVLGCFILIGLSAYFIVRNVGKTSLLQHGSEYTGNLEVLEEVPEEESIRELQDGEIYYNGDIYAYNEDLMTFLVMGIDSRSGITDEKTPGKAGQADAILLVVANPHTEEINIISVNRDTMAEIELYDTEGGYAGTDLKQITLQYAYGDGKHESCKLMESVVSDLFYGIPIHGYLALDMKAIPVINDAVGGVTVTVLEDMTWARSDWTEGKEVTLLGNDALQYIQRRNFTSSQMGTNLNRIERQKQYLTGFTKQLKKKTKENLSFPISLYRDVQKHMVTSLSIDQMTYLISELLSFSIDGDHLYGMEGELKMGEKHEEFYHDENELKEMIIQLFYEKVWSSTEEQSQE